jgi:hypothetical protein
MKLKITLKDPDGVYDAIQDAVKASLKEIEGLDKEELIENRHEKLGEQCEYWIKHGEYVTIEIDTEANTAVVCKVR